VLKYLFVLALFAFVAFMLYWRMRPYLRGVRRFLGVVREVNRMRAGAPATGDIPRKAQTPKRTSAEKLARCASCGTWMPSSRAVKLGGATYCSHACMERAADSAQRQRKSAS
jgi:hypothetical protein